MFPSWHFILFIYFFDSVFGNLTETNNKTHDVIKKNASVAPAKGQKVLLKRQRHEDPDEPGWDYREFDIVSINKDDEDGNEDEDDDNDSDNGNDNDESNSSLSSLSAGPKYYVAGVKKVSINEDDRDGNEDEDDDIDSDDGDENDDSEQPSPKYYVADVKKDVEKRSLQTGDTFTPMEFLPIAAKFLAKVTPGEGRGIISGSKTPEDLADKLFAAYFLTSRRIVTLTEKDLSGLDALTALALEGEAVRMRSSGESITEKPIQFLNINGQNIGVGGGPMRCHYKLLFKKVSPSESILRKRHNGATTKFDKILKMEKKMRPNRQLIVNHKGRKSNKDNIDTSTQVHSLNNTVEVHAVNNTAKEPKVKIVKRNGEPKKRTKNTSQKVGKKKKKTARKNKSKQKRKNKRNKRGRNLARNKKSKKQRNLRKKKSKSTKDVKDLRNQKTDAEGPLTTTPKPACRWRYICRDPGNLDSCRIHTSCYDGAKNEPMLDENIVDTKDKDIKEREKSLLVMNFRKMLGLTALDEEVEKIIELHVMVVKPENLGPNEKIETLDQYFNNIIMAQHAEFTTPAPSVNLNEKEEYKIDEKSSERRSQDLKLPHMGFESAAEGLRYFSEETIKEMSASTKSDDEIKDAKSTAQKYRGLVESTASMMSSTSKYNKKFKM